MSGRALALALASILGLAPASAARTPELPEYATDVSGISWWLGDLPSYCADVSIEREICTWRTDRSLAIACEVDRGTGRRVDESACVVRRENDAAHVFPPETHGLGKQHKRGPSRQDLRDEAAAAFEAARTLRDMTRLIGVGLAETLPGRTENHTNVVERRDFLRNALDRLRPRERRVLRLLYPMNGDMPVTMRLAGRLLRISESRVAQIRDEAISRIRAAG